MLTFHENYILKLSLLTLLLLFVSCSYVATNLARSISGTQKAVKKAERFVDSTNNREVIFVKMMHIGKEEEFAHIKSYLDFKKQQGFVVYYEGVIPIKREDFNNLETLKKNSDTLQLARIKRELDTIERKIRRVVGHNIPNDYTDPNEKSISSATKKQKYVGQTPQRLGLGDTTNSIRVDMTYPEILARYEKEIKPIVLTEYDWETPLNEKYNTPDTVSHNSHAVTSSFRNDYLTDRLLESEHKKIVVLYGASHFWFVYPDLLDNGFSWHQSYDGEDELESYLGR